MYQVVASDLDGTLLSPDHTLSPYAKETLKLLTARGVNFVFATGRHRVNVSFSTLTCLEVMAGGVSKGHALEAVAKRLGFDLKDCIAFGDGMNDAEMLSMAGKGCIMQNAHQRLKDLHPELEVIGTNADNAVPKYLRKLFLE
ncbi:HAD-IIB family hydrolase [Enterobacter hormaechei subsp. xiangfangensis]|nr:HAD-IIB family hydrolase [Enterobacter hormaechei subsp. xiangfangensis]